MSANWATLSSGQSMGVKGKHECQIAAFTVTSCILTSLIFAPISKLPTCHTPEQLVLTTLRQEASDLQDPDQGATLSARLTDSHWDRLRLVRPRTARRGLRVGDGSAMGRGSQPDRRCSVGYEIKVFVEVRIGLVLPVLVAGYRTYGTWMLHV
ncbi:hypothetical protein NQZ68_027719 [Dissostichus eleginoides]|nr:hypothetical protein NQZ68_027719 [Dissostichus eleginoides]